MYYAVTHLTIYNYSTPINDSVMELRLQPRSDGNQRSVRFTLDVSPPTKVFSYKDHLGNMLHTFDIPATHTQLAIKSESVVEVRDTSEIPEALPENTWERLDHIGRQREFYDMLQDGKYAHSTDLLRDFSREIDFSRNTDPLTLLRRLNSSIYDHFDYVQHVTRVDSPIDVALKSRRGVCQDFTHIMLALTRSVGIPARYVSGYLFHRRDNTDRSDEDASHAWVEAWLPDLGWVGFDPTNNIMVKDRHIRVSVANDYANASPSRGVFRGDAKTKLEVRVKVAKLDELPVEEVELSPEIVMPHYEIGKSSQEQQQQQQQQ